MPSIARGVALVDVLASATVILILAGMTLPVALTTRDRIEGRFAARYLAGRFHAARLEAVRRNAAVALEISASRDDPAFRLIADGNGDGVRAADIASGIDPPLEPAEALTDRFPGVRFEVPFSLPEPDGSGRIEAGSDPLRFGSTAFIAFSPLGSATSGTAYLTDRSGRVLAVRILGATGRVRVLTFERHVGRWTEE
ncbi:MAG: GspH/FimT family pseudopilin [Acidobacteriota bacterium]